MHGARQEEGRLCSGMMFSERHKIPVKIAYIGGGSLNWAHVLMSDLAYDDRLAAQVRLYDVDRPAAERNAQIGAHYAAHSRGKPARYTVADSLQQALTGADLVVISILPGRFQDMAKDIDLPACYGIAQAVGDTVGPGGFVRALRAIPMMVEIAEAIRDHAPNAYVCNLTNPMSVLTGALYAAFPDIRAWGECHEVTKLRHQVAWIANQESGLDMFSHRDVQVNVLGINHFSFVDRIALDGQDMMSAYRTFAEDHLATGWQAKASDPHDEFAYYFESHNRVSFDLMRRFGVAAAAGDRHLAEFLPCADYLSSPESWGFALTPVSFRIKHQTEQQARAEKMAAGREAPKVRRSDEALIDQIHALMSGKPFVSNVNLPNRGQMDGLPAGTVVETNAMFSGLGVQPVTAGRLPDPLHAIVADHALRQSDLLQAALDHDRNSLFGLFCTDPLVAPLSQGKAKCLFDEMLEATATWLPAELKGAA